MPIRALSLIPLCAAIALLSGLAWAQPASPAKHPAEKTQAAKAPAARDAGAKAVSPHCAPPVPEGQATTAADPADSDAPPPPKAEPAEVWTEGSVTQAGGAIAYCAVAGTLTVHPKDWDDAAAKDTGKGDSDDNPKSPPTTASMFYVAYVKQKTEASARPIMFLFNGGPGSSTVWLHMGAFGPMRVDTGDARHAAPAPYRMVNNDHSLLDVSDLVFIDAPGTGFSRAIGPNKEQTFYGVDEDAHAFAEFIATFLSKYRRWNSPKYLFGESYGTTRAAVLVNMLQDNPGIDFNGVVMLSQVLATGLYPDQPKTTPGNDMPYLLGLPTYAATAWYHRQPPDQRAGGVPASLLNDVERFAMGDYAAALAAGGSLDAATRDTVVAKLHEFTGLSVDYLRQADLRVSVDEFRQELLRDSGRIVGATDTRFAGHTLDRMSRKAKYDPSDAAIGSAYVSSFNDYVRGVLKYGEGKTYRPMVDDIGDRWNFQHQPPDASDASSPSQQPANVMPDLARAMKTNPFLKVQLNAGYFDLLTPYFQGKYEMRHLTIPPDLRANIEYRCYQSGHMVYVTAQELARLHDNVANFVERTDNLPTHSAQAPAGGADCASDQ